MPSDQKTRIPRVPIQTPMFDEDGNLTRTWILFFERIGLGADSGAGGGGYDDAQFNVAVNGPVTVGEDVPPHKIINQAGTPVFAKIEVKIPPTGSGITVDVKLRPAAGGSDVSIFGDTKLVIPDGSTDVIVQTVFADGMRFHVGDRLLLDVTAVGSTYPGSQIVVTVFWLVGA